MSMIREALLALGQGEKTVTALAVSPSLGAEAVAIYSTADPQAPQVAKDTLRTLNAERVAADQLGRGPGHLAAVGTAAAGATAVAHASHLLRSSRASGLTK